MIDLFGLCSRCPRTAKVNLSNILGIEQTRWADPLGAYKVALTPHWRRGEAEAHKSGSEST